jgi:hypothetical protein
MLLAASRSGSDGIHNAGKELEAQARNITKQPVHENLFCFPAPRALASPV